MTLTAEQVRGVIGLHAIGADGSKAGKVEELFTSTATGEPEWVTLKHGLFGSKHHFAPLAGATVNADGDLVLSVTALAVADAPGIENDGQLTSDEIGRLYSHYGLTPPPAGVAGTPAGTLSLQRYVVTEQTTAAGTTQVGKQPI
jgi:hypothetical protein